MLAVDIAIKGLLVALALRRPQNRLWMAPALLYTLVTTANHTILLQRFDLVPAAIGMGAILAFGRGRHALAGLLVALGVGCKLYPVLFAPPLLFLAYRQGRARQFAQGSILGLVPLMAMSLAMPWWRFLAFHAERGLQAESLWASLLWFGSELGWVGAKWMWVRAWFEVDSPVNSLVIPIAQALFPAGTFYAEVFVCWRAWRQPCPTLPSLARLLLVPLTAFIALNLVLSPQFLFWTAGLAGIALLEGSATGPACLALAAAATPLFYPTEGYGSRLTPLATCALLLRNALLLAAVFSLTRELWPAKTEAQHLAPKPLPA